MSGMELTIHVHIHNAGDGIGERIMAVLKDVQDALAALSTDLTTAQASLAADFQSMLDAIAALKAAGAGAVTSADLDALVAQINGVDATVKAIPIPAIPA